jgi:DNA mismatch repair protein MLH3
LEASIEHATKLSKEGLKHAKLVAQVDKKYILVKIPHGDAQFLENEGEQREMLVLIDQHAMDERVKVEELFDQLCQVNTEEQAFQSGLGLRSRINCTLLSPPLIFEVTAKEAEMLREYAAHFADWGILYNIESTPTLGKSTNQTAVKVETLSPVIAVRLMFEPKLLISLLRSEIWKLSEIGMTSETRRVPLLDEQVAGAGSKEKIWLKRIGYCPRGIVDMVHSRACRSAVMFNDDLERDECKELLRKMAECAFPFQCAHGRPSMVPLVSLGSIDTDEQVMTGGRTGCFVDAYKKWRMI